MRGNGRQVKKIIRHLSLWDEFNFLRFHQRITSDMLQTDLYEKIEFSYNCQE